MAGQPRLGPRRHVRADTAARVPPRPDGRHGHAGRGRAAQDGELVAYRRWGEELSRVGLRRGLSRPHPGDRHGGLSRPVHGAGQAAGGHQVAKPVRRQRRRPGAGSHAKRPGLSGERRSRAMPAPPLALLIAASFVLVVEFLLPAGAGLVVYQPGIDRFAQLTGLTPSPPVYRAMGVLALAGVAGIIGGGWRPPLALVAAAYFALLAAFTLTRQLQRGQRGPALLPYSLFLLCAVIVVAIRASSLLGAWAG